MLSKTDALKVLEYHIRRRLEVTAQITEVSGSGLPVTLVNKEIQRLQERDQEAKDGCLRQLDDLLDFPPRHIGHQAKLEEFWEGGGYHRSVFIMTKFPGTRAPGARDAELARVLAVVSRSVTDAGFIPRIASDAAYDPMLWLNVEIHLLGCRQGIAIVEDCYLPELNPNVAMEWGWMRAMKKPVLYLVENDFDHDRADLSGLTSKEFAWADPEQAVVPAVTEFLGHQAGQLPPDV